MEVANGWGWVRGGEGYRSLVSLEREIIGRNLTGLGFERKLTKLTE